MKPEMYVQYEYDDDGTCQVDLGWRVLLDSKGEKFHLPLRESSTTALEHLTPAMRSCVERLSAIDGIVTVSVSLYSVTVEKAEVFDWEADILPEAIRLIRSTFPGDSSKVEIDGDFELEEPAPLGTSAASSPKKRAWQEDQGARGKSWTRWLIAGAVTIVFLGWFTFMMLLGLGVI